MHRFQALKKGLLSQEVRGQLIASITSGKFKPGDKLPSERELMEQFGVSRVTIRDALGSIKSMGLITTKRGVNGGAYVSEPNPDPITENFHNLVQMGRVSFPHLIEARLYLEPPLARNAALYRTNRDVDNLHELLRRAESQVGQSNKKARLANVRFHLEVGRITSNPILLFILESITQAFSALIIENTQASFDQEVIRGLIGDHLEILEAIVKQQPEVAEDKTKDHLLKTHQLYSQVMSVDDAVIDERLREFN